MSSRYFVARYPGSWRGVAEVEDHDTEYYYHHQEWPVRSTKKHSFYNSGSTLDGCTDPITGWWIPMIDEDLVVDEGL